MRFEHLEYCEWFIKTKYVFVRCLKLFWRELKVDSILPNCIPNRFVRLYPNRQRPARAQPNASANQPGQPGPSFAAEPDVTPAAQSTPLPGGQPNVSADEPDVTPANPPALHGFSVQAGSLDGQMTPMAQSTPLPLQDSNAQTSRPLAPLAQSTPLRPVANAAAATATSNVPIVDYGDEDAIFDNAGVNLPPAVQNGLAEIQSQMDSNVRQRVNRVSDSLNTPQVDRIQSIETPDPNAQQVNGAQAVSGDPVQGAAADSVQGAAADPNGNEPIQRVFILSFSFHSQFECMSVMYSDTIYSFHLFVQPDRPRRQRRPRQPRQQRPPQQPNAPPRRPPNPVFPTNDDIERLGDFVHADDNGIVAKLTNFQVNVVWQLIT